MARMESRKKGSVNWFRWAFRFCMLFGFLFNINLIAHISTTNLVSLVAFIHLLLHKQKTYMMLSLIKKSCLSFFSGAIFFCMLICLVNTLMYSSIGASGTLKTIELLLVFFRVIVFSVYCLVEYSRFGDFVAVLVVIFIVQAVAVFAGVVNPEVRMYLYDYFYFGDDRFDITVEKGTRIVGIALNSASGGVVCSTVIAALCAIKIKGKIIDWLFWALSGLFMTMTFFISRTGVFLEIGLIAAVFLIGEKQWRSLVSVGLMVIMVIFGIHSILSQLDPQIADLLLEWMTAIFDNEGRQQTLSGIAKHIPAFSIELVFGTGVMRGRLPFGDYVQSDSGYIMMYCAIGIVGALLYYFAFLVLLLSDVSLLSREESFFVFLMTLLAFIIEYKEPFFLGATYAWIVLTIKLFLKRERQRRIISYNPGYL